MQRALVLTNHMHSFAGSETVALEVAECLEGFGYTTEIRCNLTSDEFKKRVNLKIPILDGDNEIDFYNFDFIWSQHNLFGLAKSQSECGMPLREKKMVSASLSPYEPFESIGITAAILGGAHIAANSAETAKNIVSHSVPSDLVHNFKNAAPKKFFNPSPIVRTELKNLLVVSNHIPPELKEALSVIQQNGVSICILGRRYDHRRLMPEDLTSADAVITIGKTVQYSIMAGVPVYCYDRFGGPGWLGQANFDNAEFFNFSGRCTARKLSGDEIAFEIHNGFGIAALQIRLLHERHASDYFLEDFIAKMIELPAPKYELEMFREVLWSSERASSGVVRKLYRKSKLHRASRRPESNVYRFLRRVKNVFKA